MPELPDLEVFKSNIFSRLTSKRLVSLEVFSPKITTPKSILEIELIGRDLSCVSRYGKELLFDFADNRIIAAHLMLNGKVSIVSDSGAVEKIKSKVFALNFERESVILHDTGNVGTVIRYKPIIGGAPDALGKDFTLDYFIGMAQRKATTNIKAFLIDQKVVKGIGNAYADEILWSSRISPKSITGQIPGEAMAKLYNAIGKVLSDAVVSIKAIAPDIISGEERSFLNVHSRFKKKTETGFPIIVETIASKTTYFTEEQIAYVR